jgi:uncharacterized protein (TIGR02118 family)
MMYLIKRRPETSREELVVHWFANHMPAVIESQAGLAERDKPHATRYIATLFEADQSGNHAWDGVAQLWWPQALAKPAQPHGSEPTDTFQQKAEPYDPWPTTEYVVIDGSANLPVTPLTLNAPFPTTRSGFFKVTFLVVAKPDTDFDAFFAHWLDVHVPNVESVMDTVGGLRYVVSHSIDPGAEPYAGMAELYFSDPTGWKKYRQAIQADGMEEWASDQGTLVLRSN